MNATAVNREDNSEEERGGVRGEDNQREDKPKGKRQQGRRIHKRRRKQQISDSSDSSDTSGESENDITDNRQPINQAKPKTSQLTIKTRYRYRLRNP